MTCRTEKRVKVGIHVDDSSAIGKKYHLDAVRKKLEEHVGVLNL